MILVPGWKTADLGEAYTQGQESTLNAQGIKKNQLYFDDYQQEKAKENRMMQILREVDLNDRESQQNGLQRMFQEGIGSEQIKPYHDLFSAMADDKREQWAGDIAATGRLAGTLLALPEDQQAAAWPSVVEQARQAGVDPDIIAQLPEAYPGPDALKRHMYMAMDASDAYAKYLQEGEFQQTHALNQQKADQSYELGKQNAVSNRIKASRPDTVVNVSNASQPEFYKQIGRGLGDQFIEQRDAANTAVQSLQANAEAMNLLNDGMITGAGANTIVAFGKGLQRLGVDFAPDAIANSEAFVASRAKEVGRLIEMFGAGTGLSDADREFATKAAAGNIEMTEQSIRKIIDINERASRTVIQKYNAMAGKVDPNASPFPLGVEEPATLPAQGGSEAPKRYRYNPETGDFE